METQRNNHWDGRRSCTGNNAWTGYHQGQSHVTPQHARRNLMEENAALKAQLIDSHFQQNLFRCKWEVAEQKITQLKTQLAKINQSRQTHIVDKSLYCEEIIKDLKDKLDRALNNDTKAYEEHIDQVKLEVSKARTEQVNVGKRLNRANKVIEMLRLELDETNMQLQQTNTKPAEEYDDEEPTTSAEAARIVERQAALNNQSCTMQDVHTECEAKEVKLQHQLRMAENYLRVLGDIHKSEMEQLNFEIGDLKDKLFISEALKDKYETEARDVQVKTTKDSYLTQLTELQKQKTSVEEEMDSLRQTLSEMFPYQARVKELEQQNMKMVAELKRAESDKASLQLTLQRKEDEWKKKETMMETRLNELESTMSMLLEKKTEKKKRCWLVRMFTRFF